MNWLAIIWSGLLICGLVLLWTLFVYWLLTSAATSASPPRIERPRGKSGTVPFVVDADRPYRFDNQGYPIYGYQPLIQTLREQEPQPKDDPYVVAGDWHEHQF